MSDDIQVAALKAALDNAWADGYSRGARNERRLIVEWLRDSIISMELPELPTLLEKGAHVGEASDE